MPELTITGVSYLNYPVAVNSVECREEGEHAAPSAIFNLQSSIFNLHIAIILAWNGISKSHIQVQKEKKIQKKRVLIFFL